MSPSRCGASWLASLLTELRIGKPEEYFVGEYEDEKIIQQRVNLLGVRITMNRSEMAHLKKFSVENIDQEPFFIQVSRRDVIGQITSAYLHKAGGPKYVRASKGKPLQKYENAYEKLKIDDTLLAQTISEILEERDLLDRVLYMIPNSGHLRIYYEDLFDMPIGQLAKVANTVYMASADRIIQAIEKQKETSLVARDFYPKRLVSELESKIRRALAKQRSER